jgi:endonuclease/exonuclease/phosphatase family metal-dependent hydrolase
MLKVLTLNIWNRMGPYDARLKRIREWVERLDPDVIGFQEVLRGPEIDQLADLTDGFGYETAYGAVGQWGDNDFGNAVASRWRIRDREVTRLPEGTRDENRCAVATSIEAPFGDLCFTSTHLNWKLHDGSSRERQVQALSELVLARRPRGGFPPVVVGDFNAEPDSAEIRFMRGYQTLDGTSTVFFDAWSVAGEGDGATWSNRNAFASIALEPERRIDYIFAGYPVRMTDQHGVGKIETCRVVCNDEVDGVWPSDHFGLYAELRTDPLPRPEWSLG